MKNKIVFFDIDGTLLDHDKKLPASAKTAVKELQEKGIHVAIATGRAPFMIEEIRRELGIDSYVTFNGQYVVFEGKIVYEKPLTNEQLTRLTKFAEESGHSLVYSTNSTMKASIEDDPLISDSMASLRLDYPEIDKVFYEKENIYQVLLFCEDKDEESYRSTQKGLDFVRWHNFSCDVLPGGGSKAVGVEKLIEASGLKIEDAYAFGDGLNDLEMIRAVGMGVAMGNAVEALKQEADLVVGQVDDNGLAEGLKKLELIG